MDVNEPTRLSEKAKYERIHAVMDYSSASVEAFVEYCQGVIPKGARILEIGSGTGMFLRKMQQDGWHVTGSDITLLAIPDDIAGYCYECAAWDLPFPDDSFDWIVSTDVLEHIPTHLVPVVCREMGRVAMYGQVHNIATFAGQRYLGMDVHLTVKPISWWWKRFNHQINDVHVIERSGQEVEMVRFKPDGIL